MTLGRITEGINNTQFATMTDALIRSAKALRRVPSTVSVVAEYPLAYGTSE